MYNPQISSHFFVGIYQSCSLHEHICSVLFSLEKALGMKNADRFVESLEYPKKFHESSTIKIMQSLVPIQYVYLGLQL